jgi:hypothetical protein
MVTANKNGVTTTQDGEQAVNTAGYKNFGNYIGFDPE